MPELPRFAANGKPRDAACPTHELARNLVVSDGGVEETIVRLAVGSAKGAAPTQPLLVDQKRCLYAPRVLGITQGQKVAFRNSDPTFHNIHGYVGTETDVNEAQPAGSADRLLEIPVVAGDLPYHAKCDVHPWMDAYILVTDHPFFATTGTAGQFVLENVPPGSYNLEAWHPSLGKKSVKVKVVAGKTAEVKLTFQSADYKAPK